MAVTIKNLVSNKSRSSRDSAPDTVMISSSDPVTIIATPTLTDTNTRMANPTLGGPSTVSMRDRQSAAGKAKGFRMPFIGNMPLRQQLQILGPLLLGSLALTFLFLVLDSRNSREQSAQTQSVGDLLVYGQRLSKTASQAINGRADAFKQLRESRELLTKNFSALKDGDSTIGVPALAGNHQDLMQRAYDSWKTTDASAGTILEHERMLVEYGAALRAFNTAHPKMQELADQLAATRVGVSAYSSREQVAASQLAVLTQRLAKDMSRLMTGDQFNREAALALGKALTGIKDSLDTIGLSGGDAVAQLRKINGEIAPPIQQLLGNSNKLEAAKTAEVQILADGEAMRGGLLVVQELLGKTELGIKPLQMMPWLFGLLALLSAAGLAKFYVDDSRSRAEGAERQKREAERLEQDAKRTNDTNQSAILRLMNELQEVADGDLTVQATVSEDITGAIADSVNYTIEELRSLVARINATAELVTNASTKAQQTSSSLLAASEQQSREIRETGEAVLQMARQINDVSKSAAESAQVARSSLSAAQEGSRAVENAISGMNGIRDQIQDTAKRIKRLGESSQEIGEIVELISDITEQTNVLALNAAIQAASAGEAGRGFTVVAEEVQRLAERSAEATKQIAALIRTIQTDTQDAVAAMERSTQGVVEGTKLSDAAGRALVDIGQVSRQLAQLIERISATTQQQADSAGTVAQSIQRILLVTEQTSEGTQQTAGSIRQLSELAEELKSSVSRFKVS